jgi:hypothetical protein
MVLQVVLVSCVIAWGTLQLMQAGLLLSFARGQQLLGSSAMVYGSCKGYTCL